MDNQSMTILEDVEEDIPGEIETFVRLNRMGNFKAGEDLYKELLQRHTNLFPAVAEHADFLLEQGSYGLLKELLEHILSDINRGTISFKKDEVSLLQLLKALANMHTHGNLQDALKQARSVWASLPKSEPEKPSEVEIHIFEVYLQIVVFASQASSWLRPQDTQLPWIDHASRPAWEGFCNLCRSLNRQGRPWESQKILRLLLNVLPQKEASKLCEEFMETIHPKVGGNEVEDKESVQIANLSATNACIRCLTNQKENSEDLSIAPEIERWASKARSLWKKIQINDTGAPKGRPFFEMRLAELTIAQLTKAGEGAKTGESCKQLEQEADSVSDLSIQAECLWAMHKLGNKWTIPDQDTFKRLREIQVNHMQDSLGYVKEMDKSLELYLRLNREKKHQIPVPEAYLEHSLVLQDAFNAPGLVERHYQNQIELGQLRNDDAQTGLAKSRLQKYHQSTMPSFIPLQSAVEHENIARVRQLLNMFNPINERSTDGSTALHHAVYRCRSLAITDLLLEHGADPNLQTSSDGYAPLHVLVSTSYRLDDSAVEFLNRLISYKADIHLRTFENGSVVGLAACQNLAGPIRRLLDLGADPNSPFMTYRPTSLDDNSGTRSALGIAAWHAHIETMKVLIDAGADVNHDDFGQTPLTEIVCNRGVSEDPNRYVEGARLLLDAGADINWPTRDGWTPLARAAYNGNLGLVKLLVDRGADPNGRTPTNKSYLRLAREQQFKDIAEYLAGLGVEDS